MAIDSTVSGASANSYNSISEVDVYFEGHPYGSGWQSIESNISYATVLLQSLVDWKYPPATTTQALQFPVIVNGVAQTEIPQDIKVAQNEISLYLENNDSVLPDNSLKALSIGSIDLDFNENKAGTQELLSPLIQGLLSKWGTVKSSGSTGISNVDLVRG